MEQEKFPYKIWPGMLFVAVLIGSGLMLKQVSRQPEDLRSTTDPQPTGAISIDGWAEKIRQQLRSS